MKILILGAGQVGSSAAEHLSREEANEVTVVDTRPDVLRELQDRLDGAAGQRGDLDGNSLFLRFSLVAPLSKVLASLLPTLQPTLQP